MAKQASTLKYERCTTHELRRFIHSRTGQWPLIQHGRRAYLQQLRTLDRNRTFPRFSSLPQELRDRVYGNLVLSNANKHSTRSLEVLRASRTLNQEAENILHLYTPLKIVLIVQRIAFWAPQAGKYVVVYEGLVTPEINSKLQGPCTQEKMALVKALRENKDPMRLLPLPERLLKARHVHVEIRFANVYCRIPLAMGDLKPTPSFGLIALNRILLELGAGLSKCSDLKTLHVKLVRDAASKSVAEKHLLSALYPILRAMVLLRTKVNRIGTAGFPQNWLQSCANLREEKEYTTTSYTRARQLIRVMPHLLAKIEKGEMDEKKAAIVKYVRAKTQVLYLMLKRVQLVDHRVEEAVSKQVAGLLQFLQRAEELGLIGKKKEVKQLMME